MAIWQIMKAGQPTKDDMFDDGLQDAPGAETFSIDAVKAEAARLKGDGWNYVGPSPVPPQEPEEG